MQRTPKYLTFLGLTLAGSMAQAVPPIPESSGWSGHINIGAGVGSSKSNMLASIGSADLGDDTVSGLDQNPDDEDIALPSLAFELAYTFAENRTQLYLGNQVVDHLNFDVETSLQVHLGVRQEIAEIGSVDFSLAASAAPTDVWKDPYLVDEARGNTERTNSGLQISWDGIFNTPLEFRWSSSEIHIDDEVSGQDGTLGLSAEEQRTLRRTGQVNRVNLSYDWEVSERHLLVPSIGYVDFNLDGDAMAEEGPVVELQYLYTLNRWRVVSKVFYEDLESGTTNPIYNDKRQVETMGGSVTAFYSEPFGLEQWNANAGVAYYEGDSNINFYDSSFQMVSIGMFYRFD